MDCLCQQVCTNRGHLRKHRIRIGPSWSKTTSLGFSTTVQPTNMAGKTLQAWEKLEISKNALSITIIICISFAESLNWFISVRHNLVQWIVPWCDTSDFVVCTKTMWVATAQELTANHSNRFPHNLKLQSSTLTAAMELRKDSHGFHRLKWSSLGCPRSIPSCPLACSPRT